MPERVMIALGSNVGARAGYLASARSELAMLPRTRLLAATRVEETAPFGAGSQGPYLNQMVLAATQLTPFSLLNALQRIERALGRVRSRRWGSRTIDLDIVRFGELSMQTSELALPHPGLHVRDFWQCEIDELNVLMGRAA